MSCKIERVFRAEDGSRIKVIAFMYVDRNKIVYSHSVEVCKKGKRTWEPVTDRDSHSYRCLSMKERSERQLKNNLKVAGERRINATLQDLWKSIEPEVLKVEKMD